MPHWRDWNLATKLAAITVVPLVFAIALGAVVIRERVISAESYRRVDGLVALNDELRTVVGGLQRERDQVSLLLADSAAQRFTGRVEQAHAATDAAFASMNRSLAEGPFAGGAPSARFAEVANQQQRLRSLRERVTEGKLAAVPAVTGYSEIIATLLDLDRALAAEVTDPVLAATASALRDLRAVHEEVHLQQALVALGIARGHLTGEEVTMVVASRARLAARASDFRADASPRQRRDHDAAVSGAEARARDRMVSAALDDAVRQPGGQAWLTLTRTEWDAGSEKTAGVIASAVDALGAQLRDQSASLHDEAGDAAGAASVILFTALIVAFAVTIAVTRQLLRSLRILRRSALEAAERTLPEAVASIRDGSTSGPEVKPVPVWTADELGQVARAFDGVRDQALRLATEQAALRANYGEVFVNLSRRSQSLVRRQLFLLDRLERDEDDPDQLSFLFQLDHLATRMRRNNENVLVLADPAVTDRGKGGHQRKELVRRSSRPLPLGDLLRAAVCEIERYPRVVVRPTPLVRVVGHAFGGLVRLTAELLDNATAFSAPDTKVIVTSRLDEEGRAVIEVRDQGIGMDADGLAEANARLADGGVLDASTSRRMGLFVVSRLAARHGVHVSLQSGNIAGAGDTGGTGSVSVDTATGVLATVVLPAELLLPDPDPPVPGFVAPAPRTPVNDSTAGPTSGAGAVAVNALPRRRVGDFRLPGPLSMVNTSAGEPTQVSRTEETGWFSALGSAKSDEDAATAEAGDKAHSGRGNGESTPIFDEMISIWFRDPATDGPDVSAGNEGKPPVSWEFAADDGWRAAEAISRSAPATHTAAGLPQRVPREQLVPGGVGSPNGTHHVRTARQAEELRERLSRFQRGISQGRRNVTTGRHRTDERRTGAHRAGDDNVNGHEDNEHEQESE